MVCTIMRKFLFLQAGILNSIIVSKKSESNKNRTWLIIYHRAARERKAPYLPKSKAVYCSSSAVYRYERNMINYEGH